MRRAFVLTFAAGAVLSAPACKDSATDDPPVRRPADKTNPTTTASPKPSGLPRLEDLKSGHPEGATNPPSLYLIVTPAGKCYGSWEGGMIAGKGDRVEPCPDGSCGTEVQCPPKATELLTAYSASAAIIHKNPPNPPPPPKLTK